MLQQSWENGANKKDSGKARGIDLRLHEFKSYAFFAHGLARFVSGRFTVFVYFWGDVDPYETGHGPGEFDEVRPGATTPPIPVISVASEDT